MSISLVQFPVPFSNTGAPLTSLQESFSSNNAAQNFLLCSVILQGTGTNNDTIAIADTLHNTYQSLISQSFSAGSCLLRVFYVASCIGGANTVTATISGGNSTGGIIFIREWNGVGAVDTSNFGAGSGLSLSSGNINTAQPVELVYGVMGADILAGAITSWTPGSGFTSIASSNGSLTVPAFMDEYQITAATGAFAATGDVTTAKSTTIAWGSQVAAFSGSQSSSASRVHVQSGRGGYGPHRNWQGPTG